MKANRLGFSWTCSQCGTSQTSEPADLLICCVCRSEARPLPDGYSMHPAGCIAGALCSLAVAAFFGCLWWLL